MPSPCVRLGSRSRLSYAYRADHSPLIAHAYPPILLWVGIITFVVSAGEVAVGPVNVHLGGEARPGSSSGTAVHVSGVDDGTEPRASWARKLKQ